MISGFVKLDYLLDSLYSRRLKDEQEHKTNSLDQLLSQGSTTCTDTAFGEEKREGEPLSRIHLVWKIECR